MVFDERTELSRSANEDVIASDVRRRGESITRIVNVYDEKNAYSGVRLTRKLNWQKVIQPGSIVVAEDSNAHSI